MEIEFLTTSQHLRVQKLVELARQNEQLFEFEPETTQSLPFSVEIVGQSDDFMEICIFSFSEDRKNTEHEFFLYSNPNLTAVYRYRSKTDDVDAKTIHAVKEGFIVEGNGHALLKQFFKHFLDKILADAKITV